MGKIDETNVTEERSVKAILTSVKMYENLIAVQHYAEETLDATGKKFSSKNSNTPLWKIREDISEANKASKILLVIEELTKDQNRPPIDIYRGLASLL